MPKDPKKGLEDLHSAVKQDPENGAFRLALGEAEMRAGNLNAAETQLLDAVKRLPGVLQPKLALATCYFRAKNYGKAYVVAEEVLATTPRNLRATQLRTAVLIEMKSYDRAREDLARSEKIGWFSNSGPKRARS